MKMRSRIRGKNISGAVTMEYVLLCLMISAAVLMMIITFSRALARQFALVSYAMAGHSSEDLSKAQERFRKDEENDQVVGEIYSDYMHGERADKK